MIGVTFFMGSVTSKEGKTTKVDSEEEELALLDKFHKDFELTWPFILTRGSINNEAYGEMGVPMVVIVDRKGVIRRITTGYDETLKTETDLINRLLAEKMP
jgi:hypothetical protein